MEQDMTKGSPLKLIICFAIPLMIGCIFQQVYVLSDTFIVGRTLGVEALGAVGCTGSLHFFIFSLALGATSGFAIITGQEYGAKNYALMRKSVCTSFMLCFALSLICTLTAAPFTRLLLTWMHTPTELLDQANDYLFVQVLGMCTVVGYNMLAAIIRALGDSKTPLYFLIFSCIVNVILDYCMIIFFHTGTGGPAFATVLTQLLSAILCLAYVFKKFPILKIHREDWGIDWSFIWQHIRLGMPMALQGIVISLGCMIVQYAINGFGKDSVSAVAIGQRVLSIAFQPVASLGIAVSAFVAQNYGAKEYRRILSGVNQSMLCSAALGVLGAVLMFSMGDWFCSIFMKAQSDKILQLGHYFLKVTSLFLIPLGAIFVYRSAIQSLGYTLIPTIASFIEIAARLFAVLYLAPLLGFTGICLSEPSAWTTTPILFVIVFYIAIRKLIKQERRLVQ